MAKLKGLSATISVSVDDATYYAISEMTEFTHPLSASNEEVTAFGDTFIERLQTLKDSGFSCSGFYDPADTNGQVAIRTAWLNDTALYVKVLYDGTNGFTQEVKVSTFELAPAVDNVVPLSIEFEGTGAITATP